MNEDIININSKRIVDALSNVTSSQEMFDAFCEIPTESLLDIDNMIDYILHIRVSKRSKA